MTKHTNSRTPEPSTRRLNHVWLRSTGTLAILAVTIASAACEGARSSPTRPGAPVATFTLSGTVSETASHGGVPVPGVLVVETISGQHSTTDAAGFYSLVVSVTSSAVRISKTGYLTATRAVTVSGDMRLDLELARNGPYRLSGMVFETTDAGRVPIQGVSVYCDSCGSPEGHTFADTDEAGFYSFGWVQSAEVPLIVRKDGYGLRPGVPRGPVEGWIVAPINGDTRFDIELVRR